MKNRAIGCTIAQLALMFAVVLWAPLVYADWAPVDGHKMHFPQLPDEAGWDVKAMYPNMLADDWQCSQTGLVRDLHFWGSWKGGMAGNIKAFNIVIFEDIPKNLPTVPFSRPGRIIKRFTAANFVAKSITAATMEGWYDPSSGTILPNDHQTYFQYNIFLTPTQQFFQEAGKIYWLGIWADVEVGPFPAEWGWKSTKDHWNDDAVWGPVPTGGVVCDAPDNGTGTASQPALCSYFPDNDVMRIIDGLPPGEEILIETELVPLSLIGESPGGSLGGTRSEATMELHWHMRGTGSLSGFVRDIVLPVQVMTDQAARTPGTSPQSFATDLMRKQGQLPPGDPDFDLLRITGGTDFGLPSPGHTTLTQTGGGTWNVESFFDITYRIDFVGHPGGPLGGMSGSTTGTIRMGQGSTPVNTWTDMYEPQIVLPPISNSANVVIDPNGAFAGGSGTDAYGDGWYTYPSGWYNIWFYDHPFDTARYKRIHIEFDLIPLQPPLPSVIEIAVNWSTNAWSLVGNPPGPRRPPLPGEDEALYIGRTTLHVGTDPSGHYVFDYTIPDYNPEWVSFDVRGRNFIFEGRITHECLPKNPPPSLDLSFVITNGGQPLGACCITGVLCQQLTAAACLTAGGIYMGDGVSCTPDPCSPPREACCFPNGTCVDLDAATCLGQGGTPQGAGTACATTTCPQPKEACCFPNGTCSDLTPADCQAQGGTPMGAGSTCATVTCPTQIGACCLPNGTCIQTTAADCQTRGGVYQGNGVSCAAVQCPQPPRGACCLTNGNCVLATAYDCQLLGGTYQGNGTLCAAGLCPTPGNTGACCLPNGTCVVTTAANCHAQNGIYKGNGTACAGTQCPPPPESGACCMPDGTCVVTSPTACKANHGAYQGNGTSCTPNPCGRPKGACCYTDALGIHCGVMTKDNCTLVGGVYFGDGTPCTGTSCDPTGSTEGACCLPNGAGCIVTTPAICADKHGTYLGNGTVCTPTNCPTIDRIGACCLPDGQCIETTVRICVDHGGVYEGDGTVCSPTLCGAPCCIGTTGNVNALGIVDLSDLSAMVSYLTGGGYVLPCYEEANVNAAGIIDLADLSALVSYLTGGGYILPFCP